MPKICVKHLHLGVVCNGPPIQLAVSASGCTPHVCNACQRFASSTSTWELCAMDLQFSWQFQRLAVRHMCAMHAKDLRQAPPPGSCVQWTSNSVGSFSVWLYATCVQCMPKICVKHLHLGVVCNGPPIQ